MLKQQQPSVSALCETWEGEGKAYSQPLSQLLSQEGVLVFQVPWLVEALPDLCLSVSSHVLSVYLSPSPLLQEQESD
jgi:hypothetical protein